MTSQGVPQGLRARFPLRRGLFAVLAVLVLLAVTAAAIACTGAEADPPDTSSPTTREATLTAPARAGETSTPAATAAAGLADTEQLVAARPYRLVEPSDARSEPAPLIVVLHGYGQGADYDSLGLEPLAEQEGVLLAYLAGTVDGLARRFWNASEVCCNFFAAPVDDVAYVRAVIDDVSRRRAVDPKRVYVAGFSNGAFMAHRLACELPDRIAAIVAVSGVNATPDCRPSQPVGVLQVHGDADPVVHYLGGRLGAGSAAYPSVITSIEGWRDLNGCGPAPEVEETVLDVASELRGWETSITRYEGCAAGGAAELWTVHGGSHDIAFSSAFAREVWAFLAAHGRG